MSTESFDSGPAVSVPVVAEPTPAVTTTVTPTNNIPPINAPNVDDDENTKKGVQVVNQVVQEAEKKTDKKASSVMGGMAGLFNFFNQFRDDMKAINNSGLPEDAKKHLIAERAMAAVGQILGMFGIRGEAAENMRGMARMFLGVDPSYEQTATKYESVIDKAMEGVKGLEPTAAADKIKANIEEMANKTPPEITIRPMTLDDWKLQHPYSEKQHGDETKYNAIMEADFKKTCPDEEHAKKAALTDIKNTIDSLKGGGFSQAESHIIAAKLQQYSNAAPSPPPPPPPAPKDPAQQTTAPAQQTVSQNIAPQTPAVFTGGATGVNNTYQTQGSTTQFGGTPNFPSTASAYNGDPLSTSRDPNDPSLTRQFGSTLAWNSSTAALVDPKIDNSVTMGQTSNFDQTIKFKGAELS